MRIFTMNDIIPLIGLPHPPQGRSAYYIPCPCCDSGRERHLNINLIKNVFRCPRCGFSGGVFDLYAHYTGIKTNDVRDELLARANGTGHGCVKTSMPCPPAPAPALIENSPTDVETRDATYRALLGKLSLANDHRENLLKRGLSGQAIDKNGYRTTPLVGTKFIARQLLADGLYLSGIPGFYRDDDGDWTLAILQRGILIPVRDRYGRIQGLQIRRDNVARRKFRWVSSTEKTDGCRAEGWIHLAGPLRERIILTEGPMKADVIYHLSGQTVVAVPGVNALTRLEHALTEFKDEGVAQIMSAFDMDFMANPHVQNGYNDLARLLHRMDFQFGTYIWPPEYKGLDDYIWALCTNKAAKD